MHYLSSMGVMITIATGHRSPLRTRSFIGRARDCDVVVNHAAASRLHAALAWLGNGWEIQDLGSNNGTFVDGTRVPRGTGVPLGHGATLGFGTPEAMMCLEDASGPQPFARAGEGAWVSGEAGSLELPDPSEEGAVVWQRPSGDWVLEAGSGVRVVVDGEVVTIGGRAYQLILPAHVDLPDTLADGQARGTTEGPPALEFDRGQYLPEARCIASGAGRVTLSPLEAKLLDYLAAQAGRAASHREILSAVWGYREAVESRTLYVTVDRLRRKIERDPKEPRHLLAVPGLGYMLVLDGRGG